jgi:hypothetical protein
MSAHIHLARSICRRAERNIVRLSRSELINPLVLVAVDRISDPYICCRESPEFSIRRSRYDMEQNDGPRRLRWTADRGLRHRSTR